LGRIERTRLVVASRLYRTRAFGPVPQPDFINAAAGLLTQLTPSALLAALHELEAARGRVRAERWGPRILDLDLLVFAQQQIDSPDLTLPHPGIAERGFVLAPLAELAPDLIVPGVGRVAALLSALLHSGIEGVLDS
jgi:2-amino-4-hydroxy-6-hydroxymethyldihydropteridine diphosphokinase